MPVTDRTTRPDATASSDAAAGRMFGTLRATVLVIDDSVEILSVLTTLLKTQHRVLAANSGEVGLRIANGTVRPDLILLDVMMPGINGYAVLNQLRANPRTHDIPVVFLTALAGSEDEGRGLELGAADYITKPVSPVVLRARVGAQLQAKMARDWLRDKNALLDAEVARRMAENDITQQVTIRALAHLAEMRDNETGNHILRTQGYVRALAQRLSRLPQFTGVLSDERIAVISRSAPLHDIGKVGIEDHILHKPGRLDPAEMAIMRTHAVLGSRAIEQAERDIAQPVPFLAVAKEIAHWHHEWWDGSGYPDGLAGEAIPLSARLMAVADVFDALISRRVYKPAWSFAQAREAMAAGSGGQFDPVVLAAFLEGYDEFVAIARLHQDELGTAETVETVADDFVPLARSQAEARGADQALETASVAR